MSKCFKCEDGSNHPTHDNGDANPNWIHVVKEGIVAKILTCPECSRKIKQIGNEMLYCTGRKTPDSVGHKKIQEMR